MGLRKQAQARGAMLGQHLPVAMSYKAYALIWAAASEELRKIWISSCQAQYKLQVTVAT